MCIMNARLLYCRRSKQKGNNLKLLLDISVEIVEGLLLGDKWINRNKKYKKRGEVSANLCG
jgi:hypothetical protein